MGAKARFQSLVVLIFTIVPGIVALTPVSKGTGRLILTAITLVCGTYAIALFLRNYRARKIKELQSQIADLMERLDEKNREYQELQGAARANELDLNELREVHIRELEEAKRKLNSYLREIGRVIDRQSDQYRERLEVTAEVGENDEEDVVREKLYIRPTAPIPQHAIRPIVPTDLEIPLRFEDLNLKCRVDTNRPTNVQILHLLETNQRPRVWLSFDPPISEQAVINVEYRPVGLWRTLRSYGADRLAWDNSLPSFGNASAINEFLVRFLFPASEKQPTVSQDERQGGDLAEPEEIESGQWNITWHDTNPAPIRYSWEVVLPRNGQ